LRKESKEHLEEIKEMDWSLSYDSEMERKAGTISTGVREDCCEILIRDFPVTAFAAHFRLSQVLIGRVMKVVNAMTSVDRHVEHYCTDRECRNPAMDIMIAILLPILMMFIDSDKESHTFLDSGG
jgi:hypothetical protein